MMTIPIHHLVIVLITFSFALWLLVLIGFLRLHTRMARVEQTTRIIHRLLLGWMSTWGRPPEEVKATLENLSKEKL